MLQSLSLSLSMKNIKGIAWGSRVPAEGTGAEYLLQGRARTVLSPCTKTPTWPLDTKSQRIGQARRCPQEQDGSGSRVPGKLC